MKKRILTLFVAVAFVFCSGAVMAENEFEPQIKAAYKNQIQSWLGDAAIVDAIKA